MKEFFSFRDLKHEGSFTVPFPATHSADVQRMVQMMISEGQTLQAKFPADFELWRLGFFEPDKGIVPAMDFICNLSTLVPATSLSNPEVPNGAR